MTKHEHSYTKNKKYAVPIFNAKPNAQKMFFINFYINWTSD